MSRPSAKRSDFGASEAYRQLRAAVATSGVPTPSAIPEEKASAEELEAFRYEHPKLCRDPREYVDRGQVFLTIEPDDPAPVYLPVAMGETGRRVCGMAVDYGHWDATLVDCVSRIADHPEIDADYAVRLLSTNTLEFYGNRLKRRIGVVEDCVPDLRQEISA